MPARDGLPASFRIFLGTRRLLGEAFNKKFPTGRDILTQTRHWVP
jgi:hypothetical protein